MDTRRCQTIANHLTAIHDDLAVLIITGSPVVGSFDLHPRVGNVVLHANGLIDVHGRRADFAALAGIGRDCGAADDAEREVAVQASQFRQRVLERGRWRRADGVRRVRGRA